MYIFDASFDECILEFGEIFYCNLEIENLDNDEFTIDTRIRVNDIILNPTILSQMINVPNMGDNFINKPSQWKQYEDRVTMNETISIKETLGATQTKELKTKYRLFHRIIA